MENLLHYLQNRFLLILLVSIVGSVLIMGGLMLTQWIIFNYKVRYKGVKVILDIDKVSFARYSFYVAITLTTGLTIADLMVNVGKVI